MDEPPARLLVERLGTKVEQFGELVSLGSRKKRGSAFVRARELWRGEEGKERAGT